MSLVVCPRLALMAIRNFGTSRLWALTFGIESWRPTSKEHKFFISMFLIFFGSFFWNLPNLNLAVQEGVAKLELSDFFLKKNFHKPCCGNLNCNSNFRSKKGWTWDRLHTLEQLNSCSTFMVVKNFDSSQLCVLTLNTNSWCPCQEITQFLFFLKKKKFH